jgi:hypothetical protein
MPLIFSADSLIFMIQNRGKPLILSQEISKSSSLRPAPVTVIAPVAGWIFGPGRDLPSDGASGCFQGSEETSAVYRPDLAGPHDTVGNIFHASRGNRETRHFFQAERIPGDPQPVGGIYARPWCG